MTAEFSISRDASQQFQHFVMEHALCRLPLRLDPENVGQILDADGRDFATADVNGDMTDAVADARARIIVATMNRFGGFEAGLEAGS